MHQSSLTGNFGLTAIIIITVLYLIFLFVIDTMWEIPKAELKHGTEIAKGRCGVSVIGATLTFVLAFAIVHEMM